MSKDKEELKNILKKLEDFCKRTDTQILVMGQWQIPVKEMKEFPSDSLEFFELIEGDKFALLNCLRIRHRDIFKKFEERDKRAEK